MDFSVHYSCRAVLAVTLFLSALPTLDAQQAQAAGQRWTEEQANAWYAAQPWPVASARSTRRAVRRSP